MQRLMDLVISKDILSGFDVLRAFGRTNRFINEGDSASDEMGKSLL